MDQFCQHAADVLWVQERDRGAHRAVPRPRVDQAYAGRPDRLESRRDVRDPVADVMHSLAAAGQEPADRCVWAERLEQLDVRPLLPGVDDLGDGPSVQLWPHRHGTDAMYICLLRVS